MFSPLAMTPQIGGGHTRLTSYPLSSIYPSLPATLDSPDFNLYSSLLVLTPQSHRSSTTLTLLSLSFTTLTSLTIQQRVDDQVYTLSASTLLNLDRRGKVTAVDVGHVECDDESNTLRGTVFDVAGAVDCVLDPNLQGDPEQEETQISQKAQREEIEWIWEKIGVAGGSMKSEVSQASSSEPSDAQPAASQWVIMIVKGRTASEQSRNHDQFRMIVFELVSEKDSIDLLMVDQIDLPSFERGSIELT